MLSEFTFKKLKEQCLVAARQPLLVSVEREEELRFMWQALTVIANTHPNYEHLSIEQVFEALLIGCHLRHPPTIPPKQEFSFEIVS